MDTLFERLLKEKIVLMLDMRMAEMTTTRLDHEDYCQSLGYIEALRNVMSAIEEIKEDQLGVR